MRAFKRIICKFIGSLATNNLSMFYFLLLFFLFLFLFLFFLFSSSFSSTSSFFFFFFPSEIDLAKLQAPKWRKEVGNCEDFDTRVVRGHGPHAHWKASRSPLTSGHVRLQLNSLENFRLRFFKLSIDPAQYFFGIFLKRVHMYVMA